MSDLLQLDLQKGLPPGIPTIRLVNDDGTLVSLEEMEKAVIGHAIRHLHGHVSEVARQLQIGRSTLYRKLEQLGLHQKKPRVRSG
jgi:DNA-binding NtrC family response regulator